MIDPGEERVVSGLRQRLVPLLVMGVLAAGAAVAVVWLVRNHRSGPPPRKAMQFAVVNLQPQQKPPEPPPPKEQPKPEDVQEPENERVELRSMQLPPDAPPPEPTAGPLALATEGTGPGDAFGLAGNPGGKSLVSGSGLGGGGVGGEADPMARYGYYYNRVAAALQDRFRRDKVLASAPTRTVELRVWQDGSGTVSRVELVRSTGDERHDRAIEATGAGLRLPAPPQDVPMPMILRLTIRRPQ